MHNSSSIQAKRILLIQVLASIAISAVLLIIDRVYAESSLAGGVIATLANAYLAWKVFAKQKETTAEQILVTVYAAEVGKIILTVMMFIGAILIIKPLSIITLLGVYLFITMIPWLASFYINDDNTNWRAKNVR